VGLLFFSATLLGQGTSTEQNPTVVFTSPDTKEVTLEAVAPDYATSGRFYVYYTGEGAAPGNDGDIVIERYQRSPADPVTASPTQEGQTPGQP
jgi:hypothetical protein